MAKNKNTEGGFDDSLSIENLKTVKELETVLSKCEKAAKALKKDGVKLVFSLSELKQLYAELKSQHGHEAVEPDEKLEKLKKALSEWVEMYHVVNGAVYNGSFTEDDEKVLSERYQNFSDFLSEVKSYHHKEAVEEAEETTKIEPPPIPVEPPPIPESVSESEVPSLDDIEDLVFSEELKKEESQDINKLDERILKNIENRLETNSKFIDDWLRQNFSLDYSLFKNNFLLMIGEQDPLFKKAYKEVAAVRSFVNEWLGKKYNELKKDKNVAQKNGILSSIKKMFRGREEKIVELPKYDATDLEKYLDDEFGSRDNDHDLIMSEILINYFELPNGQKKFIEEIKNNPKYSILKEKYPKNWKKLVLDWYDGRKKRWGNNDVVVEKYSENSSFEFEVKGRKIQVGDFYKSTDLSADFSNLKVTGVGAKSITVEKFVDGNDSKKQIISKKTWEEDYAPFLVLWPKGITLDQDTGTKIEPEPDNTSFDEQPDLASSGESDSRQDIVIEQNNELEKERIKKEVALLLEKHSEILKQKISEGIKSIREGKKDRKEVENDFFSFAYYTLPEFRNYLESDLANVANDIIHEWYENEFYEESSNLRNQENESSLNEESLSEEIPPIPESEVENTPEVTPAGSGASVFETTSKTEEKTAEDVKWEEVYSKEREKIERQIEVEKLKLKELRIVMLEASRDNLMDITRKENVGLFSKLFGKGSEVKLKAKESLEKYNNIFTQYLSVLSKMIELSGILSKEPEFVKNKIGEEIEEVRQLIDKSISNPEMSPSNIEYLKRVFDIFKTHFDKEEVKQQLVQLSQAIETKKDEFLNNVARQTQESIEKENREKERSEKMKELIQLPQVVNSITNLKNLGCKNAEETTTRILSNFIDSNKNQEYISSYFSDVNTLFANLLGSSSINDDLSQFDVWLNGRKVSEEQKAEFNQGIIGRVQEILREGVVSNLEKDRDGVINFSNLEKLIQQQVHREFLSIYRSNESTPEGVIMLRPGTDIIEGLDLDKKEEESGKISDNANIPNSTEQVSGSRLRLVDSKKFGKETKYNLFIGQNLRLKNGSPVLVRDIQKDFIVVMEEDGNMVSIFDDKIEKQLMSTSGLEMSKLSGSESKDKNQWDRLLKLMRDKFIYNLSNQEISWEYQDALKQYFEANQDIFGGDYKKFLAQEKEALAQYGRGDLPNITRTLEESLATGIKSMENKARAEKRKVMELSNTQTTAGTRENISNKPTTRGASSPTAKSITNTIKSGSTSGSASGGGVARTEQGTKPKTEKEETKNKIEFAGKMYDKKMSVYLEGEDKKTNIVISKVENGKISFRSPRKGYHVMSEEEWSRLLSYTEMMDSLEKINEQIRNMEVESTEKNKNSIADLYLAEDEDVIVDEELRKPKETKGQISLEMAKLTEIGLIKGIVAEKGLQKLRSELIKKMIETKIIDKNFVNGLSLEEKFLLSFVNGQKFNGFLEDKKGKDSKDFYAYSNSTDCNLYIVRDGAFIILLSHDKPVKNVGGILVEIEDGEEYTVHYEIKNDRYILVRD